jgi:hypothetical protein
VQLILGGRALTLSDGFYFGNETRPAKDQPPVRGMVEAFEIIEEHDRPVFTVISSTLYPSIRAEVTTEDNLYWFKDETFGGEVTRRYVSIKRGAEMERYIAMAHVYISFVFRNQQNGPSTRPGSRTTFCSKPTVSTYL